MSQDGRPAFENLADDRLCRTIAAVLGVSIEDLVDHASPETISEWDSMSHLNLVMALETEFDVKLSAEDALQMHSVAAIRRLLQIRGVRP